MFFWEERYLIFGYEQIVISMTSGSVISLLILFGSCFKTNEYIDGILK